ncbi:fimbria/pilus outer membrane usher protein [Candidimonas humi]|uniref:Fimbria/pilus outer membrane usher protein n=1 Tax=Candidimonas humi TaxID=683355 RepID=A0ABV8NVI2_9BURK|nr:fimbria/pilus outer membrane usher protein [Candidimonas humi]MBV6306004.1 fimbria/pilus outer membrane usher protein [Candidimonas humi]
MPAAAQTPPAADTQASGPPPGGAAADAGAMVFLLVTVNGNTDADLTQFSDRGGRLYVSPENAAQLGFRADYLKKIPPDTPLDAYPGVKAKYNPSLQSLSITAPFSILNVSTAVVGDKGGARTQASVSPGLVLNYDLYSSYTNKNSLSLSGFGQLRAFNDLGVFSDSYLLSGQHVSDTPGWQRSTVRMDTTLQHSWQDKEITLTMGDALTNGLSWTRQTRIGGLQIARDFSLQPYQSTTPLPAYFGSAALPSAVQLYVNGIQQYNGTVPAGPFQLNVLPSVNGAGQARVVMTDALGRSTTVSFPFYSAVNLLRAGLTDWSFETGYVRQNYGYQSFDYGHDPMVSGTIRHGFTNSLTLESHFEASKGVAMGGLGGGATVGSLGTVSGSWAQSRSQGRGGSQYSLSYQLQHGRYSLGANTQRALRNFADVATQYGSAPILRTDSAYVSVDTGMLGSFGLNYAYLQQAGQPRSRYAGASWSRTFAHGVTLGVAANQNLDNHGDRTISLNLSINFDKGVSAYGSAVHSKDSTTYTASVNRSAQTPDGWSWGVQAQQSDQQGMGASGQVSRHAQYADIGAGINSLGSDQTAYATASGSIVAMGGGLFASRRIYDGFAVVSTDGVPDVPVKEENRPVGKTDSRGLLLVPGLQSYQNNKVSIDPTNLAVDMRIKRVNMNVVPRQGSGVNVKFVMERVHAASLILHQPDGKDVPMGAQAFLNGSKDAGGWVGYDGRLYLEGLQPDNRLIVSGAGADCSVQFPYHAKADTLPEIGPLTCKP